MHSKSLLASSSLLLLTALSLSALAQPASTSQKIVLTPDMVVNEAGVGNAGALVDEQDEAGDPRAGKGGKPKTLWNDKLPGVSLPVSAYIDLGGVYKLTDLYVYDTYGKGVVPFESGTPPNWKPLVTEQLDHYQEWNAHPINVETRYVRVTLPENGLGMPEIVLYGTPTGPIIKATPPEPHPHQLPTMDELLGTNAFNDDDIKKLTVVGYVREYHNWDWDAGDGDPNTKPYPDNVVAFNPSKAGNGWNFDAFYTNLKKEGIMVCPAIQGTVKWLAPKRDDKPVDKGQDPALPASYKAHADEMFQFVARYGSAKVDDKKLKLASNQERVSGLDLIHYFENGNEEDGWWRGRQGYSTPYEFAAQCSADYDGNMKAMGDTFGVKNADPNARMVMAGLAGDLNLGYVKAMKAWADANRHGDFPADVINFHTYCNSMGGQGDSMRVGVSPEQARLKERLREIVDYRNRYLPRQEVWLTEFGYDTNPKSVQCSPAIGETSTEEVQARWLVRSFLAIAAAGIDRAAQFMFRDTDVNSTEKFDTSGLVLPKGDWTPKTSWFYISTMKNRLAGMRFSGEVDSGDPKVLVYKFRSDKGTGAYAVWCPTASNTVVDNYQLKGLGSAATLVEFAKGEPKGKASPLTLNGGTATLKVSECPVLVLVDSMAP